MRMIAMNASPRIRTINAAWAELRKMDPDSCVSQHFIRELVACGEVPSLRSGNRYLVDFDALLDFLNVRTGFGNGC